MATAIPQNHARMTLSDVLVATGGSLTREARAAAVEGFTTDSRAVRAGCAFVALRGANHDGHAFLGQAARAGAGVVVVERGRAQGADLGATGVVEVDDTLVAWGALGRAHLEAWRATGQGRTVAITGSAGKTTTKELTARLLGLFGPCHATTGNLNNRIGVPSVAFGVQDEHRFAVFEVGMSVPGEILALADVVRPDVGVLLNVGVAHAGGVGGTRADVAREKGALLEALAPAASAVVNADDDAVLSQVSRTRAGRTVSFGRAAGAEYRLVERTPLGERGSHLVVEVPRGSHRRRIEVDLPLPGDASAVDLVAAIAATEAASGQEIPEDALARAAAGMPGVSGRLSVRRLEGDILVLDDTYNANPASMRAALETLGEVSQATGRRSVAVLGEMKELGDLGPREHELLGEELARWRVGLVIGCGGLIDKALSRAAEAGVPVARAEDTLAAARLAVDHVKPGDAVLLKGSRAAAVERVWEALERKHGARPPAARGAP